MIAEKKLEEMKEGLRIYKEKRGGGELEAPSLGLFGPKRASKSALKTQRTLATFRLLGSFKRKKKREFEVSSLSLNGP